MRWLMTPMLIWVEESREIMRWQIAIKPRHHVPKCLHIVIWIPEIRIAPRVEMGRIVPGVLARSAGGWSERMMRSAGHCVV